MPTPPPAPPPPPPAPGPPRWRWFARTVRVDRAELAAALADVTAVADALAESHPEHASVLNAAAADMLRWDP